MKQINNNSMIDFNSIMNDGGRSIDNEHLDLHKNQKLIEACQNL